MEETKLTSEQLKADALAELTGSNESTEQTVENEQTDSIDSIENNSDNQENNEIDVEWELEEWVDEEENEWDEEEKSLLKEEEKEKIRKEVEKEMKKKYYSKLNKEQRKLQETENEVLALKNKFGYDDEQVEAIRKIARAETQVQETNRIEKIEKNNFIKKFNPSAKEFSQIEEIKKDLPQISWEYARKLYLADNNPEALIKKKSPNLSAIWWVPKEIVNKPLSDRDELYKQAVEEANIMAWKR